MYESAQMQAASASADPVELIRTRGMTSHLCAFVRTTEGKSLGLLSVPGTSQRTFSHDDSALLNAVADIIGVRLPALFLE